VPKKHTSISLTYNSRVFLSLQVTLPAALLEQMPSNVKEVLCPSAPDSTALATDTTGSVAAPSTAAATPLPGSLPLNPRLPATSTTATPSSRNPRHQQMPAATPVSASGLLPAVPMSIVTTPLASTSSPATIAPRKLGATPSATATASVTSPIQSGASGPVVVPSRSEVMGLSTDQCLVLDPHELAHMAMAEHVMLKLHSTLKTNLRRVNAQLWSVAAVTACLDCEQTSEM